MSYLSMTYSGPRWPRHEPCRAEGAHRNRSVAADIALWVGSVRGQAVLLALRRSARRYVGAVTKLAPTAPHEVSFKDVRARDAFLRWSVPTTAVTGCWAAGSGVALVHRRPPRQMLPSPWAVLLGQPADRAR